ncbi:hypothetical protein QYZ88_007750 [Lachnospiraceae bacterium C1.1]|nr:hypothetical protein [Lachnospiraceae bacterium C1.1]
MDTVELIIKSATSFYNDLQSDANGRYRSWEHCYKCFHDARENTSNDYDYLSLQLAFYLASWGMYRGSSFLLQKDYKVHIPVVEEMLKSQYDILFGIDCVNLRDNEVQEELLDLEKFMADYYNNIRKSVKENRVKNKLSTTLITKILMGTFGCVPAYDRYFIDGIKDQNVSTGNYNLNSLLKLADFYENNLDRLEKIRKRLKVYDLPYPQMKLLDMGFWQIGFEKDGKRGIKVAH